MKINKNLKYCIIGVSISLIIVIAFFGLKFLFALGFSKGSFVNDEKLVNNSYNNSFISNGNLALLNDELYFNYNGKDSIFFYGLYRINGTFGHRIQWDGPSFSPGNSLLPMQVYKNNLLLDSSVINFNGTIYKLNTATNSITKYSVLENSKKNQYHYFKAIDDKLYVFSSDKIYVSDDGVKVKMVFDKSSDIIGKSSYEKMLYIKNDILTYVTKDGYIIKYDIANKKEILRKKFNLKEFHIDDLYAIKNIFVSDNKLYLTTMLSNDDKNNEIFEISDKIKKIYSSDIDCMNVCDNYIYIGLEDKGIEVIDTHSYKSKKLTEEKADEIYVLGDKWVYFVDGDGVLKRVTQKGGNVEKVYG